MSVRAEPVEARTVPDPPLTLRQAQGERKIAELIRELLIRLGEDPEREGLVRTPARVERTLQFLTQGYRGDIERLFDQARFVEQYDEMVLVRDIDFSSLCEHHLLPFYGKCHVAYIPDGKILGLSKIPRLVDLLSRRLQVQERLTCQVAEALKTHLKPKGVAVVMEAQHLCTIIRGVQKQNTRMVTSSMLGMFRTDPKTRMEFLSLIQGKNG